MDILINLYLQIAFGQTVSLYETYDEKCTQVTRRPAYL